MAGARSGIPNRSAAARNRISGVAINMAGMSIGLACLGTYTAGPIGMLLRRRDTSIRLPHNRAKAAAPRQAMPRPFPRRMRSDTTMDGRRARSETTTRTRLSRGRSRWLVGDLDDVPGRSTDPSDRPGPAAAVDTMVRSGRGD